MISKAAIHGLMFAMFFMGSTDARAQERVLVACVGDSNAAGFLAATSADPSVNQLVEDRSDLNSMGSWHPHELFQQASLSDTGVDFHDRGKPTNLLRLASVVESNAYNWCTGSKINSHANRLRAYYKKHDPSVQLDGLNFAVSGSRASNLLDQADDVLRVWKKGVYNSIPYLAVTIGANDACAGVPNSIFLNQMRYFFAKLSGINQRQKMNVIITAVPRVPDFTASPVADYLPPNAKGKSCRQKILKRNYCNSLANWNTPSEYQNAVGLIDEKNQMLVKLADEVQKLYPNKFDIHFAEETFYWNIPVASKAKDCFHLNAQGQADASAILWQSQPWYRE